MTAIPRKMHPSCFIPSLGSVSLTSSGNTDTKAETIKSMMRMMMDGYEVEVTDVEETSGREREDPGGPDLHGVGGVQGEGGQGPQHAHTGRPDLSLAGLPPGEAALQQYCKVPDLVRDLVDQDGEGGDQSHFKR